MYTKNFTNEDIESSTIHCYLHFAVYIDSPWVQSKTYLYFEKKTRFG